MKKIMMTLVFGLTLSSFAQAITATQQSTSSSAKTEVLNLDQQTLEVPLQQNGCSAETICPNGRRIWCWSKGGHSTRCESRNLQMVYCEVWGNNYDSASDDCRR